MNPSCCVICDSGLEKSNIRAVRLLRWNQVKVNSIINDPYSDIMMRIKKCTSGSEYQRLIKSAKRWIKDNQDNVYALSYHDRYGQCHKLELDFQSVGFKAKGSVKIGQVLEVIGKKKNERLMRAFLRKCADESVKVIPKLATSSVDYAASFDSAIYISLHLESYLVIRGTANGTMSEQKELPYEGEDKASLFNRVASVLLNENGYRAIFIDNIVGVGLEKEKQDLADPYEWIKFIRSYAPLCDKWLVIGIMIPDQEMTEFKLYEGCDAVQLGQMINCLKDYDNVRMINFAGGHEAAVEDV